MLESIDSAYNEAEFRCQTKYSRIFDIITWLFVVGVVVDVIVMLFVAGHRLPSSYERTVSVYLVHLHYTSHRA